MSDVPNLFLCMGYTNSSWTLKVDLTNKAACRLIQGMQQEGFRACTPHLGAEDESSEGAPLLHLTSGYVRRKASAFPQQLTNRPPFVQVQNYFYDKYLLEYQSLLHDPCLQFQK